MFNIESLPKNTQNLLKKKIKELNLERIPKRIEKIGKRKMKNRQIETLKGGPYSNATACYMVQFRSLA